MKVSAKWVENLFFLLEEWRYSSSVSEFHFPFATLVLNFFQWIHWPVRRAVVVDIVVEVSIHQESCFRGGVLY